MAKKPEPEKGPSKMSMVRNALSTLGTDAKPIELQTYVKDTYKTEIPTQQISSYKSMINNSSKSGKVRVSSSSKGNASFADLLSFVAIVREWEEKIGTEAIQDVFEALY
jgi:hypothetical protein